MSIRRWALRLVFVSVLLAGFNYWLWSEWSPASAIYRGYASVGENSYTNFTGIRGNIRTGNPTPVQSGSFSNQTLWAENLPLCNGFGSWIETGWTKIGSASPVQKFFYQLPQYNCEYNDDTIVGTAPAGYPLYELYCYPNCTSQVWTLYINGQIKAYVATGWLYGRVSRLEAGGEVSVEGNGMDGDILLMQYRRGSSGGWTTAGYWDYEECSYGYNLQYTTGQYDSISDSGYTGTDGVCDHRPR